MATTSPAYSCPKMNSPYGGIFGMPSWMIFRSVPQTPQARTRTSTSSSPGTGTGRCASSNRCGATRTVAVMVVGIAMVAPFRSGGRSAVVYIAELRRSDRWRKITAVRDRRRGMMIRRATFTAALVLSLFAPPPVATAQPPKSAPLVGFLPLGSPSSPYDRSLVDAFRMGLRDAGVVENRDVVLDVVWTSNELELSQAVVKLVQRGAQ